MLPVHPLDAVQLVAFVELHAKLTVFPGATEMGPLDPLAVILTVGAEGGGGAEAIFTVTESFAVPPVPVQLILKVVGVVRFPLA